MITNVPFTLTCEACGQKTMAREAWDSHLEIGESHVLRVEISNPLNGGVYESYGPDDPYNCPNCGHPIIPGPGA